MGRKWSISQILLVSLKFIVAINDNTALRYHFFQITQAQGIGQMPANTLVNNIDGIMQPPEGVSGQKHGQVIPLQTSKPRRLIILIGIMTAELIPSRIIAQRYHSSANARTASVGSSLPCALSAGYSS